jgi:hypothetical protein
MVMPVAPCFFSADNRRTTRQATMSERPYPRVGWEAGAAAEVFENKLKTPSATSIALIRN